MNGLESALLTDYYQLTMLQGYFDRGMNETAVFELFVRQLPAPWNFLDQNRSAVCKPAGRKLDFL